MGMLFYQANKLDIKDLEQFLVKAHINHEEIQFQYEYFMVAKDNIGNIIGTIGLLPIEKVGLMRSLVVSPDFPLNKIPMFVEHMLVSAINHGLEKVYLAVNKTTAISFFEAFDFELVNICSLPEEIISSPHVENLIQQGNCQFMQRIL